MAVVHGGLARVHTHDSNHYRRVSTLMHLHALADFLHLCWDYSLLLHLLYQGFGQLVNLQSLNMVNNMMDGQSLLPLLYHRSRLLD